MTVVLEARNLSLPPGEWLYRHLNFSLRQGEMLGVAGPSGCGKSTLCLALSGIIPHSVQAQMEGEVFLLGENTRSLSLPQIATRAGIVFQDPETQLFLPQIRHELAFGPENLCRPLKRSPPPSARCLLTPLKAAASQPQRSPGQRQLSRPGGGPLPGPGGARPR